MTKAEIHYVLFVVSAYISSDSPVSYGKLVELLGVVCPGLRYGDLYPVLFNVRQDQDPIDAMALEFDCRLGARALLEHMKRDPSGKDLLAEFEKTWSEP